MKFEASLGYTRPGLTNSRTTLGFQRAEQQGSLTVALHRPCGNVTTISILGIKSVSLTLLCLPVGAPECAKHQHGLHLILGTSIACHQNPRQCITSNVSVHRPQSAGCGLRSATVRVAYGKAAKATVCGRNTAPAPAGPEQSRPFNS